MANRVLKWQSPPHHLLHALFRGKLLVILCVFICAFAGTSLFLDYVYIYIYINRSNLFRFHVPLMFFDISHSLLLSVIAHTSNCSQKHGQVLIGTSTLVPQERSHCNDLILSLLFMAVVQACFAPFFGSHIGCEVTVKLDEQSLSGSWNVQQNFQIFWSNKFGCASKWWDLLATGCQPKTHGFGWIHGFASQ